SPGDCLAQLGADRVAAGYKPPWSGLVPWESLSRRGKVNRLRRILGLASPKPRLADFRVDPDRAFLELVMAADSLMREKGPRLSKAELAASVESLSRRPGSRAARMAVALSEPRTASNPETWTRIVLLDAGLPRGIPNDRVEDPRGGTTRFIDVRVEGYRIGIEYQGGYHFEKAEVGYEDMVRREQLRELGWVMVEAGRRDGPDQSRLVRRVAIEIARIERLRLPSPQG
ncbi:MAG: hypothetical protein LBK95_16485, partial [Bifidobacteriaceae bacterium]|nr:hypothetical protein [Bifidobacteriaceae bacterium]